MDLTLAIYLALFLVGLIGALAMFFLGGDFGADMDLDMDGFGADGGAGGFSALVIFIVLTAGGAFGMIFYNLGWDMLWIHLAAWAIAVLLGAVAYLLIQNFFIKAQSSSSVRADDFVGRVGKITTTVTPEASGVISFTAKGVHHSMSCKSKSRIETGQMAKIIKVGPNMVWVKPYDVDEEEDDTGEKGKEIDSEIKKKQTGKSKSDTAELDTTEL